MIIQLILVQTDIKLYFFSGDVLARARFGENTTEEPVEICVTLGGEHERKK